MAGKDGGERAKKWRLDVAHNSWLSAAESSTVPFLLAAVPLLVAAGALVVAIPAALRGVVARSVVISAGAFACTRWLLPVIGAKVPRAKYGCDLLKRPVREAIFAEDKTIPECLGLVSGGCFVLALVATEFFDNEFLDAHEYSAAMLSVVFAVLLGFADDILDLEWKYKYVLPPLMSLPLLSAYSGGTTIAPPRFARRALVGADGARTALGGAAHAALEALFGGSIAPEGMGLVDLGGAYALYMVLLAVFCTNAINIYAGVNGLEAGQTYVVACAILTMSAIELGGGASPEATKNFLFSVTVMLPFCATTLALLKSNWFPARAFVGDTFTNYAGMALAVVAILGHFPLMLMALMVPQLLNFLLSIPQLFKLRPCPRHRLPTFDERTGLLRHSRINDRADIVPAEEDGMNLTLINAALRVFGPMTEPALASTLLAFQFLCCGAAVWLRFHLAIY